MYYILLLTQYFTRIPIAKELDHSKEGYRTASYLLSLHGAFIALIPVGISLGFRFIGVPAFINAMLTLALYLGITGAYHLDGLADSLDGLFSGRPRDKILEIMKDPTMGSWGATGLFMDLALKVYVIHHLIVTSQIFLLPLLAGSAKLALALAAHVGKKAKVNSSANLLIGNLPASAVLVNYLFCLLLAYFLGVLLTAAAALALLFPLIIFIVGVCHRRIGGITGDNLGFSAEAGEILLGIFLVWL